LSKEKRSEPGACGLHPEERIEKSIPEAANALRILMRRMRTSLRIIKMIHPARSEWLKDLYVLTFGSHDFAWTRIENYPRILAREHVLRFSVVIGLDSQILSMIMS
jgi:hypothetical protein